MSDEADSYIGVRPCGCITAWMSMEHSTKAEVKQFYSEMAESGRAVQFARLEDIKGTATFAPRECRHKERVA